MGTALEVMPAVCNYNPAGRRVHPELAPKNRTSGDVQDIESGAVPRSGGALVVGKEKVN